MKLKRFELKIVIEPIPDWWAGEEDCENLDQWLDFIHDNLFDFIEAGAWKYRLESQGGETLEWRS